MGLKPKWLDWRVNMGVMSHTFVREHAWVTNKWVNGYDDQEFILKLSTWMVWE